MITHLLHGAEHDVLIMTSNYKLGDLFNLFLYWIHFLVCRSVFTHSIIQDFVEEGEIWLCVCFFSSFFTFLIDWHYFPCRKASCLSIWFFIKNLRSSVSTCALPDKNSRSTHTEFLFAVSRQCNTRIQI